MFVVQRNALDSEGPIFITTPCFRVQSAFGMKFNFLSSSSARQIYCIPHCFGSVVEGYSSPLFLLVEDIYYSQCDNAQLFLTSVDLYYPLSGTKNPQLILPIYSDKKLLLH